MPPRPQTRATITGALHGRARVAIRAATAVLAGLGVLASSPGSARAESDLYLPLVLGATWEYEGLDGGVEVQSVTETEVVFGDQTYVITFLESPLDEGLRQFWKTTESGDVYFRGYDRPPLSRVYVPAILWVDAPLELGKTWEQTFDAYSYPDGEYLGRFGLSLTVHEDTVVSTPAGEFHAFGLGSGAAAPLDESSGLEPFSVTGRRAATAWWSEFVGRVQYDTVDLYRLTSFELPSTPVRETSWATVKSHYD